MSEPRSRQLFTEMVAGPDAALDLGHAALLIACEEYPDLDVPAYLGRLDAMAAATAARAGEGASPEARYQALGRYLFQEERFRGNSQDYYDPRNSFLNEVLDRRTGIPVSLSTLYLELARRLGLAAAGVGLPGHFIVRVDLPGGERLLDPFDGGRGLTLADCQQRLDRVLPGRGRLEPAMLAGLPRRQVLARTLRNLKAIYMKADDQRRALAVVELLLRLDPDDAEERRDRGLLFEALDCYAAAARDLEDYLAQAPGDPEAMSLLTRAVELRRRAARLN